MGRDEEERNERERGVARVPTILHSEYLIRRIFQVSSQFSYFIRLCLSEYAPRTDDEVPKSEGKEPNGRVCLYQRFRDRVFIPLG